MFWRKGITVVTHGEGGFAKVMVIGTLKNTISTITKRTLWFPCVASVRLNYWRKEEGTKGPHRMKYERWISNDFAEDIYRFDCWRVLFGDAISRVREYQNDHDGGLHCFLCPVGAFHCPLSPSVCMASSISTVTASLRCQKYDIDLLNSISAATCLLGKSTV